MHCAYVSTSIRAADRSRYRWPNSATNRSQLLPRGGGNCVTERPAGRERVRPRSPSVETRAPSDFSKTKHARGDAHVGIRSESLTSFPATGHRVDDADESSMLTCNRKKPAIKHAIGCLRHHVGSYFEIVSRRSIARQRERERERERDDD